MALPPPHSSSFPPPEQIHLPNRGLTSVYRSIGPPGSPVILFNHGWLASSPLNWSKVFAALKDKYTLLAVDQPGHALGIRSHQPFTLEAAAHDNAAILDHFKYKKAVIAGYSMGGATAALTAHLHPQKVSGLILCATAASFPTPSMKAYLMGMTSPQNLAFSARLLQQGVRPLSSFLATSPLVAPLRHHQPRALYEAGLALRNYHAEEWLPSIKVPAAVIITLEDALVPVSQQYRLAELLPSSKIYTIQANHLACRNHPAEFTALFSKAANSITRNHPTRSREL